MHAILHTGKKILHLGFFSFSFPFLSVSSVSICVNYLFVPYFQPRLYRLQNGQAFVDLGVVTSRGQERRSSAPRRGSSSPGEALLQHGQGRPRVHAIISPLPRISFPCGCSSRLS
jgi:hypothetical protein